MERAKSADAPVLLPVKCVTLVFLILAGSVCVSARFTKSMFKGAAQEVRRKDPQIATTPGSWRGKKGSVKKWHRYLHDQDLVETGFSDRHLIVHAHGARRTSHGHAKFCWV